MVTSNVIKPFISTDNGENYSKLNLNVLDYQQWEGTRISKKKYIKSYILLILMKGITVGYIIILEKESIMVLLGWAIVF